jgi:hypothetical protein
MITKADLIIHPVRLRIVGALQLRQMTTKQLGEALPDVPQATLYRQVNALVEGGILEVAEQRSINGIVESTYTTKKASTHFSREEFAAILPEDHLQYFGVFLGAQMVDAQSYFSSTDYDTTRDGMTYFGANLLLTEEEAQQLRVELLQLMEKFAFEPSPDRRMRNIAVSSIPAK